MTQDQPELSYFELINQLQVLSSQKRTGTMFIATDENRSIRFILREGQIISMALGRDRGYAAVPGIRATRRGRFSFSEGTLFRSDGEQELPKPEQLLELLAGAADAPHAEIDSSLPISLLKLREILEAEVTEYLGPMGAVVCEEILEEMTGANGIGEVGELLDRMAQEIGDDAKAQLFKAAVQQRIRKSGNGKA